MINDGWKNDLHSGAQINMSRHQVLTLKASKLVIMGVFSELSDRGYIQISDSQAWF